MRRLPSRFLLSSAMAVGCGGRTFATSNLLLGRVVSFNLADIGEGILEVQVLEVKARVGDRLEEMDKVCAVQSDKATVDITSRYAGVVRKVHVQPGQTTLVGQPLLEIEVEDEEGGTPPPTPAAAAAQTVAFKLADIGEGIQEVQVLEVWVKPGQHVDEMDKVCAVQSDKATVDITSRYSGVVAKVHVEPGKTFRVGDVLIDIAPDAGMGFDAAPASADPAATPAAAAASTMPARTAPAGTGRKALATPATRYLARQHNIDLDVVPATGKGGRVTKDDIFYYMNGGRPDAAQVTPAAAAAAVVNPATAAAAVAGVYGGVKALVGDEVVKIAGVRRGMVKTMTAAASVPMFTFTEEFEMSNLMTLRASLKGPIRARSRGAVKLSFLPFLIKSASMALGLHPDLNAHCPADCQVLIRKKAHNIGFAMDTPNGLIVPVVKDVGNKSVFDIAMDLQTLITKGTENKLTADDFAEGTFSISNIGAIGGIATSPVVLPPQVAIVALGRTQQLPRFDASGEHVAKANIMTVGFSADHRVIDGATMVRFATAWKRLVEQPGEMVMDLK